MGNVIRLSNCAQDNLEEFKKLYIKHIENSLDDDNSLKSELVGMYGFFNDAQWIERALLYSVQYLEKH